MGNATAAKPGEKRNPFGIWGKPDPEMTVGEIYGKMALAERRDAQNTLYNMVYDRTDFPDKMIGLLKRAVVRLGEQLDATTPDGEVDYEMRERAIVMVFDRVLGKAVETKRHTGHDGGAVKIEDVTPNVVALLEAALIEGEVVKDADAGS